MSENAQLQRVFLESLNFLVSLGNAAKKEHLNSLTENGILDIGSLNKFDYIIPRAAELKDAFKFVPFENPFQVDQVRRCLESVEELKTKLYDPNLKVPDFNIIMAIGLVKERISVIQLIDHEGNLNIFIYAQFNLLFIFIFRCFF